MRFLSGRAHVLTHTFYNDETPAVVASVAVSVLDESGTVVFTGAASATGTQWSVSVPAKPEGKYTVTWTATGYVDRSSFEVVGGFIFDLPELRGFDADLNPDKYTTAQLKAARERTEVEFEKITGRSFTPRTKTVKITYDGSAVAWLQTFDVRSLNSVTVGGVAESDLSDWHVDTGGFLTVPDTVDEDALLEVNVSYGFVPTPEDIHGAALVRARSHLTKPNSGIPDRATSYVADSGGQFVLATAGLRGWETGIPEVDAVIKRYRYDVLNAAVGVA